MHKKCHSYTHRLKLDTITLKIILIGTLRERKKNAATQEEENQETPSKEEHEPPQTVGL